MALPNGTHWTVRDDGADTNGGGFVFGGTGTDYSNQAAAQLSNTDLVIDATNTKISSAGSPFTSAHVDNLVQITAGTNFTTGFYRVVSVAAGLATMDRAVGTAGATGGTWALGGSLLTIAKVCLQLGTVTTHKVHLRKGTYTLTSAQTLPNVSINLIFQGFDTTKGDDTGTKPLITTSTNSTKLFTSGAQQTERVSFINISFSNTAGTRDDAFYASTGGPSNQILFYNCKFDGFKCALRGDYNGDYYWSYAAFIKCEILNCTDTGQIWQNGALYMDGCHVKGGTAAGLYTDQGVDSDGLWVIKNCVIQSNVDGIKWNPSSSRRSLVVVNCDFYNNTGAGIKMNASTAQVLTIINNIFTTNGTYGVSQVNAETLGQIFQLNNAYYNNGTAAKLNMPVEASDITLTGDPYTTAGTDFSLDATASEGALLRSLGFPGIIPNCGTGYADVGALRHQDAGGGGGLMTLNKMDGGMQ